MMSEKKFIPALGFKWLSNFYDLACSLFLPEKKIRAKLIDELAPIDSEKILEFGFGTAQNLILLHKINSKLQLSGIDIDPQIKAIASGKLSRKHIPALLELYDGKTFPFEDNSFDKVYTSLVFHHLDREGKKNSLKEIYRVLKPGGKLILSDWGIAKNKWMRLAYYSVQFLDGFNTTEDNVKGLLPGYMAEAGFSDVKERTYLNTWVGTYSYYCGFKQK